MEEKIIDKIRKLLAKSESAHQIGSKAEAEAFAQKANELLVQYNLDRSKVEQREVKNAFHNIYFQWDDVKVKNEGQWLIDLWGVISKYNFCRIITRTGMNNKVLGFTLLGETHNIEVVEFLTSQLEHRIRAMARPAYTKAAKENPFCEKRNTFIRGFLKGAVMGLNEKLQEQQRAAMQNDQVSGLIHVKDGELKDYVGQVFPNLGFRKAPKLSGATGFGAGKAAGKNLDINKGMNAGGKSTRFLGSGN